MRPGHGHVQRGRPRGRGPPSYYHPVTDHDAAPPPASSSSASSSTSSSSKGSAHPASLHPATTVVAAGRPPRSPGNPMSHPPVFASTLRAEADGEYGRHDSPSFRAIEEALGALDGGRAKVYASGMAAISSLVSVAAVGRPGIVLPRDGYHGTHVLVEGTRGLHVETVDITDLDAVASALPPAHGMLWIESPTNPMITVADIAALSDLCRSRDAVLVVDSTAAPPTIQRPLDLGADIVIHSVTKFLSGHSDLLLGAVVTRDDALVDALHRHRTVHGAIPGPMECFLALRGLRTLDVRLERAQASAAELARRLDAHPLVQRVHHPSLPSDPGHALASAQMTGFGALMSFVLPTADAADAACRAAELIVYATSLGGVETSMERRSRWPDETDVPPGLIRMSVGIEHVDDLWADLSQALEAASAV